VSLDSCSRSHGRGISRTAEEFRTLIAGRLNFPAGFRVKRAMASGLRVVRVVHIA
jgi:hypothetical protein